MTKRYFVSGYAVWDSYNNDRRVDTRSKPICDLLNQLNDENEQLRKEKECDKQVFTKKQLHERLQQTRKENEQLKLLIKKVLETTPIEHSLALDLKNSIRELYE